MANYWLPEDPTLWKRSVLSWTYATSAGEFYILEYKEIESADYMPDQGLYSNSEQARFEAWLKLPEDPYPTVRITLEAATFAQAVKNCNEYLRDHKGGE